MIALRRKQVGDVIVEFNGKKVTRSSSLPPIVGRTPVGKPANVTIIRNKSKRTIKVTIAQLPEEIIQAKGKPEEENEVKKSVLGMSVKKLDKATKKKLKLDSGVIVQEVDMDGAAKIAGIRKGDVISMLDNRSINSVDEFTSIAEGLKAGKSIAILIQRSNGPVFLAIKPLDSDS